MSCWHFRKWRPQRHNWKKKLLRFHSYKCIEYCNAQCPLRCHTVKWNDRKNRLFSLLEKEERPDKNVKYITSGTEYSQPRQTWDGEREETRATLVTRTPKFNHRRQWTTSERWEKKVKSITNCCVCYLILLAFLVLSLLLLLLPVLPLLLLLLLLLYLPMYSMFLYRILVFFFFLFSLFVSIFAVWCCWYCLTCGQQSTLASVHLCVLCTVYAVRCVCVRKMDAPQTGELVFHLFLSSILYLLRLRSTLFVFIRVLFWFNHVGFKRSRPRCTIVSW